jgi:Family of unknown function (DUF5995)
MGFFYKKKQLSFLFTIPNKSKKMAIPASNIREVVAELDIIIEKSIRENNKLGMFAALYRKVTIQVEKGIAIGRFDDGSRMERLDVVFANRYLEAFQAYNEGKPMTSSWKITFEAAKNPSLFMLQHLLAGMNAHISLDLGIATAQTAVGQPLTAIQRDFNEINALLADLIDEVEKALGQTSIVMKTVDWLAGKKDEQLAKFSLEMFRNRAWDITSTLYGLENERFNQQIADLDKQVSKENWWFTNLGGSLLPAFIRVAAVIQNRKAAAVIRAFNVD